jgi:hypothetical protein
VTMSSVSPASSSSSSSTPSSMRCRRDIKTAAAFDMDSLRLKRSSSSLEPSALASSTARRIRSDMKSFSSPSFFAPETSLGALSSSPPPRIPARTRHALGAPRKTSAVPLCTLPERILQEDIAPDDGNDTHRVSHSTRARHAATTLLRAMMGCTWLSQAGPCLTEKRFTALGRPLCPTTTTASRSIFVRTPRDAVAGHRKVAA